MNCALIRDEIILGHINKLHSLLDQALLLYRQAAPVRDRKYDQANSEPNPTRREMLFSRR